MISLLDLTIIYFALGAPVAAIQLSKVQGSPLRRAGIFIVAATFWPLFGIVHLYQKIAAGREASQPSLHHQIEGLLQKVEKTVLVSSSSVSLYEFRDVIYRYCGLLDLSYTKKQSNPRARIFEAAAHPNIRLASICYQRHTERHVRFHLDQVRLEFVDLAERVWSSTCDGDVLKTLKEITLLADDLDAFDKLEALGNRDLLEPRLQIPNVENEPLVRNKNNSEAAFNK